MKRNELKRKYTICHPVVFAMVMRDAELCKELLQRILPERKIREIRFRYDEDESQMEYASVGRTVGDEAETEKTIFIGIEAKSIRLDVLFEDDAAWYDIEMQIQNVDCPVKRSRYYHAVKAVESFKQGHKYQELKSGYVIFICLFDLFGLNQPLYRFEMREEKLFLPLNDGQVTIFLNGKCSGEVPENLKPFYLYLQNGEVCGDNFVNRMDAAVQEVIQKEEVRYRLNLYDEALRWQTMMEEAKAEAEEAKAEAEEAKAEAEEAKAEAEEAKAEAEEVKRLNHLVVRLLELGRAEDAARVLKDETCRQELIKELEL